ncbi:peptide MFS transporter [Kutzneria buriramensis]|uniref:POT family proton-dependent oligopeptide transporter n=1 Tax=Kutzneria buriramensis TaxID=1045776 RepID=A0A3E0I6N6_9PSEU|nr:peptide MFS transporter [Kutzneria buriramensis]REH54196.1 POT family proton-dependent oligopeptide transporter [Kutzneria buriramensis]
MSATVESAKPPQKGFFGHPAALGPLFFTEFWERVSYYGMRAILLYFMYSKLSDGGLGLDPTLAKSLMSIYGAAVFMSGVVGGWLADRIFGSRRAVLYGGVLIMFGHIALSFPSGVTALYVSMLLITIGTGLLKPNISNMVGGLYDEKDRRRDAGFSIFYMSTNAGAVVAPLLVGTLGQEVSYHLGFSVAAIGMFLALVIYLFGRSRLGDVGDVPGNPLTAEERGKVLGRIGIGAVVVVALFVVVVLAGWFTVGLVINVISALGILLPTAYFVTMIRSKQVNDVERSRVVAYIPLFIASLFFWMIEEQGSVVLADYAANRTDLHIGSLPLLASWFQTLNPGFIVVLAPVFAVMWTKLGSRQPSTPVKFAIGLGLAGVSYLLMVLPAALYGPDAKVSPFWLVGSFLIVILGELCLSPVGLSATTRLAPKAFGAQMLSLWFLSDAAAQGISAQIVPFATPQTEIPYFGIVGGITVLLAVGLLFLAPAISRKMQGVD